MSMAVDAMTLGKLLLAALLGGVIGLEREIHGRPAGFRTHLLVSVGACLFVITSVHFYTAFGNFSGNQPVGVDPGRVAAQVVTGIGFLGAGAIIREKFAVRGLTTAACLWIAAAIGVASGVGLFGASLAVTVISLVSLLMLKRVEAMLSRDTYVYLRLWSDDRPGIAELVEKELGACGLQMHHASIEKNITGAELHLVYQLKFGSKVLPRATIDLLAAIPGMKRVSMGRD